MGSHTKKRITFCAHFQHEENLNLSEMVSFHWLYQQTAETSFTRESVHQSEVLGWRVNISLIRSDFDGGFVRTLPLVGKAQVQQSHQPRCYNLHLICFFSWQKNHFCICDFNIWTFTYNISMKNRKMWQSFIYG